MTNLPSQAHLLKQKQSALMNTQKQIKQLEARVKRESQSNEDKERKLQHSLNYALGAVAYSRLKNVLPFPHAKNFTERDANANFLKQLFDKYIPEEMQAFTTNNESLPMDRDEIQTKNESNEPEPPKHSYTDWDKGIHYSY